MSEIITYKIKLTPIDWYFFGGETTFGENDAKSGEDDAKKQLRKKGSKEENEIVKDKSHYYAKSNYLPQETALLGMLRYQLLKLDNLLPISDSNRETVNKTIGAESFNYENKDNAAQGFGAIKSISPVFLGKGDTVYYKTPKHCNRNIDFKADAKCCFTNLSVNIKLPHIDGFLGKDYKSDFWISFDNPSDNHESDKIFQSKIQIGIIADVKNKDDQKEGFYKMEMNKLQEGFHFVFYATLDTTLTTGLPTESLVKLGAEGSTFSMQTEEMGSNYKPIPNSLDVKDGQLVFLSDAFVEQDVLSLCKFAWINTIPFRNLKTTSKKTTYSSLSKEEKSKRFNLIERGSVLFFTYNNKDAIISLLTNHYLQSFGYNQYKIK